MENGSRQTIVVIWAKYLDEFSGLIIRQWWFEALQKLLLLFDLSLDNIVRCWKHAQLRTLSCFPESVQRCWQEVVRSIPAPAEQAFCPGRYRVSSPRSCLESFSTRLSFSITSFESNPRFARFTSAWIEAERSASS